VSETVEWIDADGGTTTLNARWAASGRFAPPNSFEDDGVPGQPGARFRAVRHGVREFTLPIWITGTSDVDLRTQMRSLVAKMDPTRGAGYIRVTAPGGDQRQISCYCSAGLHMSEVLGQDSGIRMQAAAPVFRAYDVYWTSVSPTVNTFYAGSNPGSFFPFFPLRLSTSEIAVSVTITNAGDVETWPVWTITGPGSSINLVNQTSGLALTFSGLTLATGETLVIDSRPGQKTILKNDGTNLWPYVTATSSLWPLLRNTNVVRLEMSGVVTSVSSLTYSYYNRYLSA